MKLGKTCITQSQDRSDNYDSNDLDGPGFREYDGNKKTNCFPGPGPGGPRGLPIGPRGFMRGPTPRPPPFWKRTSTKV